MSQEPSTNVFHLLTQAREDSKLSLEQVANALSLTKCAIERLEAGDANYFPKGPYFVGNIKRYCGYLGVDATVLVESHYASCGEPELDYQEPDMHKAKLSTSYQHKENKTLYGVACAVMVFVLVGAISTQTIMADLSQSSRQATPSLPVETIENKESNVSLAGFMPSDFAEKPQSKP